MKNADKISEFRREFRDLVLKYNVEVEVNTGYYGDVEGIDFCVDGKRAVETTTYGCWNFDDTDLRSLMDIRKQVSVSA